MERQTTSEAQKQILEEFSLLTEWEDRFEQIIEFGKRHGDLPDELKDEQFKVKGCQSQVWLVPSLEDGRVHFEATSDAMIVRGLIALLMRVYNDRTPSEILRTPPAFVEELGLNQHLTQGRANGLASMIEQIRLYALAFNQMEQSSLSRKGQP